ncbi:MAG: gluconokinase [Leptolyngbya sp. UWPOB_LEPTO1]|uniref:gluconokinase n=1 Tax=Leptolyngbya sp. UWPOB_LEPTO1 TaxID=2815653 RepID=UPI001AD472BE|nr:gluconokinase [Leptolyngbya sp. UWPOB_LEPTO1]MBN8559807.1 gluconokinase [Leptolyngbya sp. UWPOB_LEPTO1]
MNHFIGIDIGTTSTKAIVVTSIGEMKGIASREYPLISPQPRFAEQDPNLIFSAVLESVREAIQRANLSSRDIAAIGCGSAMHSLIVMGADHFPLSQSITWADNRSVAQAAALKQSPHGIQIYRKTGTPLHPMSPLTKLLWMREYDPDRFNKAVKFISIKEYVLYQLFEQYVVDYSIAAATGLLNLKALNWDQEVLNLAQVRVDQLSQLVPTTHILQGMKPEYAAAMGLDPNVPVVVGSSDGVLANLGVGAIASDQLAITVGTSSAVRKVVSQPITDEQGRTFCYPLTEKYWVIGGASNNGGIVLRWFRDTFEQLEIEPEQDAYARLIQLAESIPVGAEGLLFLPFLSGERAPYWNADARGVFFGMSLQHQRSHFVRAVLEGILFAAYSITTVLSDLTDASQTVLASGGMTRSRIWRQMMADLFGIEVLAPEVYEASGFGGAVLAMYSVGEIAQLEAVQSMIRIHDRHLPNLERSQQYHKLFDRYQRLYYLLEPEFSTLD